MRDKIYKILKAINERKHCEECPLYHYCDVDNGVCDCLEELDNKLIGVTYES